jgi:hypothetical protein
MVEHGNQGETSQPRWLSADERKAWLRQLRAANDRILRRIDPEATTRPPGP